MSQAGTVQISYVLTIYFISQEQNNGGFVHNSLSEKKCTVGKHKNSPAYHKPGSHKGKSPYALIPNGNNMMKPYHTLSGRHGMHFSPVSSHPQFRSIIPCEVLLYIEVTFLGFIH